LLAHVIKLVDDGRVRQSGEAYLWLDA